LFDPNITNESVKGAVHSCHKVKPLGANQVDDVPSKFIVRNGRTGALGPRLTGSLLDGTTIELGASHVACSIGSILNVKLPWDVRWSETGVLYHFYLTTRKEAWRLTRQIAWHPHKHSLEHDKPTIKEGKISIDQVHWKKLTQFTIHYVSRLNSWSP